MALCASSCVMLPTLLLIACLQANLAVAEVEKIVPDIVRVREGRSVSFTCYGDQADLLYWFDGTGARITDGGSFDLQSHTITPPDSDRPVKLQILEINSVTRGHTGTYCCSITSSEGADCSSGVPVNLTVLIPSGPIMARSVQRFEANTDAFVRCSVEPGLPLPSIFWFSHKIGSPLDFDQTTAEGVLKFEANYSGLLIRDFQPSDVSNYTCEYQEPYTASSSRATIEVLLATIPYIDGPSEALIDTAVELTCHHEEATHVYWVTPQSEVVVPGDTLTIRNADLTNSGTYKCVVEHTSGEGSTVFHRLQIFVPPLPSKKTVVPFIVEGATALLTPTTTNTPHPQLTFVWTKNGERITEGEKYTVLDESGVLQIDDFSLADEGEYRCVGSNGYSEAQRDFWPKTTVAPSESTADALLHMMFTISGVQSCNDYVTGYNMRKVLKQSMAAVIRETCSCAVEVVLSEVTCLNSKQGVMKWQLVGPSAGAIVQYFINKNPNGHTLASNLTVQPCQDTCGSLNSVRQAGVISDILITAISVTSTVVVAVAVIAVVLLVLGCFLKKRRKRQFSPNAPAPQLVHNPMYDTVTLDDAEDGRAEQEEPPVLPPQVPAEPISPPPVIPDTKGYSKLQHFEGNRQPPEIVHMRCVEEERMDEASITEQGLISENQGSLDEVVEIDGSADNRQSETTADNTLGDGYEASGHLLGSAPSPGDVSTYRVNRPVYLPTRLHSSDSDGSASYFSNSPSAEMHLSVPPRTLRTDICLEEEEEEKGAGEEAEEVFRQSSEVSPSKNERKGFGKPPIPVPRKRKYSQGNVVESEGPYYDEPPPLYENVVLQS